MRAQHYTLVTLLVIYIAFSTTATATTLQQSPTSPSWASKSCSACTANPLDLSCWRRNVDTVTRLIQHLLNDRAKIALQIGKSKIARGEPLFDAAREAQLLKNLQAYNTQQRFLFSNSSIEAIFTSIINETRNFEIDVLLLNKTNSFIDDASNIQHSCSSIAMYSEAQVATIVAQEVAAQGGSSSGVLIALVVIQALFIIVLIAAVVVVAVLLVKEKRRNIVYSGGYGSKRMVKGNTTFTDDTNHEGDEQSFMHL